MLGAERDADRDAHRPGRLEVRDRDALRHPLGERVRGCKVGVPHDHGELLAADAADVVALADDGTQVICELGEDVVADRVAVDVVDALEVVEVEHHQGDGGVPRRGAHELAPQPFVERPVVPQPREGVRLRLQGEGRVHVGVVERERGCVPEANGEAELVLGEILEADAVDVERAFHASARDQRHGDQRLRVGRRAFDEADPRIEVGAVREHGLAVLDGPAGDTGAERERLVGEHLLGVLAAGEHAAKLRLCLVGLVECEVVVGDQLPHRVGDPLEQRVEALLREDVVEDVGELAIRLDELG